MSASAILKIDVACIYCGRMNSLTLGDLEARQIGCSGCLRFLGAGRDLAASQWSPPPRPRRAEPCAIRT